MTGSVHPRVPPRRGAARAATWWGKAWVRAVEESAYAERDLARARALSRSGGIGGITVDDGTLVAAVADGDELWTVTVRVPVLDDAAAEAFVETVAAETGRVAALLAGELPHELVEHAEEAGVELLPYGGELDARCTCAPWVDPCRHALAVLYQVAWLVEADPMVLLRLRGLGRERLLSRLHRLTSGADRVDDLELGLDAAVRAARVLRLLDEPGAPVDHLF